MLIHYFESFPNEPLLSYHCIDSISVETWPQKFWERLTLMVEPIEAIGRGQGLHQDRWSDGMQGWSFTNFCSRVVHVFMKGHKIKVTSPGLFFQRLWGSHLQPKAAPMLSFEGKSLVFVQFLSFFLISYLMRAAPTLSFGLKMALSFCPKCKNRGFFRTWVFAKMLKK